jgi:hypothetical protein
MSDDRRWTAVRIRETSVGSYVAGHFLVGAPVVESHTLDRGAPHQRITIV